MAQKTGKEEAEFKVVPELMVLCVSCDVAINSGANRLCQNCFKSATAVSASKASPIASSKEINKAVGDESDCRTKCSPVRDLKSEETPTRRDLKYEASALLAKREVNRCSGCRRKVGLTGFKCRCGELFCAEHRYSDRHDCSYDYKGKGRAAIARENPVIKAAKVVKI